MSLVVNPVVDGVSFLSPDPIDEDSGRVALTDLFELSDDSESVESLLVGKTEDFSIRIGDELHSLADGPQLVSGHSLSDAYLEPAPNVSGSKTESG